jgi:hypothetical protein
MSFSLLHGHFQGLLLHHYYCYYMNSLLLSSFLLIYYNHYHYFPPQLGDAGITVKQSVRVTAPSLARGRGQAKPMMERASPQSASLSPLARLWRRHQQRCQRAVRPLSAPPSRPSPASGDATNNVAKEPATNNVAKEPCAGVAIV